MPAITLGNSNQAETDIAAAATTNLGSASTAKVRITGSAVTITSFGSTANRLRFIRFAGAVTLTHSASLSLPGGVSYTTQAGDTAIATSNNLGAWTVSTITPEALADADTITVKGQKHIVRRFLGDTSAPLIEGNNAANDATNAPIWAAIGASGYVYEIPRNSFWRMQAAVDFVNGGGLEGPGKGKATLYMPAAKFNNEDGSVDTRYGNNAVGIRARSLVATPLVNEKFCGFSLLSEYLGSTDHRKIRGIVLTNHRRALVEDLELTGFVLGAPLAVQAMLDNCLIRNVHVHDCTFNWVTSPVVLNAIEVDADVPVATTPTKDLKILYCTINDIMPDAAVIPTVGYQPDGIKLTNHLTEGVLIQGCRIKRVGQGIDMYGIYNIIADNHFEDCKVFNVTLKYEAQYNRIVNNICRQAGIDNIHLAAGDASMGRHMKYNQIIGNTCDTANTLNSDSGQDTACITIAEAASPGPYADQNNIEGNLCIPGANASWALNDKCGIGVNRWLNNDVQAAGAVGFIKQFVANLGPTTIKQPTRIGAYRATTNQSIPSATPTIIIFNTEEVDTRDEYDPSTGKFTCKIPGLYRVEVKIRMDLTASGILATLNVRRGSTVMKTINAASLSDFAVHLSLSVDVLCALNQTIDATCSQSTAGARDLTTGTSQSRIDIWQIA